MSTIRRVRDDWRDDEEDRDIDSRRGPGGMTKAMQYASAHGDTTQIVGKKTAGYRTEE